MGNVMRHEQGIKTEESDEVHVSVLPASAA
jgi:hypothetical protein